MHVKMWLCLFFLFTGVAMATDNFIRGFQFDGKTGLQSGADLEDLVTQSGFSSNIALQINTNRLFDTNFFGVVTNESGNYSATLKDNSITTNKLGFALIPGVGTTTNNTWGATNTFNYIYSTNIDYFIAETPESQQLSSGVTAVVTNFRTKVSGSLCSVSNNAGRFYTTKAGWYRITSVVRFGIGVSGNGFDAFIGKTGATDKVIIGHATYQDYLPTFNGSAMFWANSGDWFEIYATVATADADELLSGCRVEFQLIK